MDMPSARRVGYRRRQGVRRRATGGRHVQQPRNSPVLVLPFVRGRAPARRSRRRRCAPRPASSRAAVPPPGRPRPCRISDPERQCGAIEDDALPGHHLDACRHSTADDRQSARPPPARPVPRSGGRLRSAAPARAPAPRGIPTGSDRRTSVAEVTITRYCAGITSSRSDVSSPIIVMAARQQGQAVSSGTSVTSIRGSWAGRAPRLARRFGRIVLAQLAIALLGFRLALGDRLLESFQPQSCSCSSGKRSDFGPNCIRVSFSSRWRSRSFCVSKVSRSMTAARHARLWRASHSAIAVSTNARSAATSSGKFCDVLCVGVGHRQTLHRNGRPGESLLSSEHASNRGRQITQRTRPPRA